jgi:hypothetical protein
MTIAATHFSPAVAQVVSQGPTEQIIERARAAYGRAANAKDIEAIELWCRDSLALVLVRQREGLMDSAISLLRKNEFEEANAAFERLRKYDELNKNFEDQLCRTALPNDSQSGGVQTSQDMTLSRSEAVRGAQAAVLKEAMTPQAGLKSQATAIVTPPNSEALRDARASTIEETARLTEGPAAQASAVVTQPNSHDVRGAQAAAVEASAREGPKATTENFATVVDPRVGLARLEPPPAVAASAVPSGELDEAKNPRPAASVERPSTILGPQAPHGSLSSKAASTDLTRPQASAEATGAPERSLLSSTETPAIQSNEPAQITAQTTEAEPAPTLSGTAQPPATLAWQQPEVAPLLTAASTEAAPRPQAPLGVMEAIVPSSSGVQDGQPAAAALSESGSAPASEPREVAERPSIVSNIVQPPTTSASQRHEAASLDPESQNAESALPPKDVAKAQNPKASSPRTLPLSVALPELGVEPTIRRAERGAESNAPRSHEETRNTRAAVMEDTSPSQTQSPSPAKTGTSEAAASSLGSAEDGDHSFLVAAAEARLGAAAKSEWLDEPEKLTIQNATIDGGSDTDHASMVATTGQSPANPAAGRPESRALANVRIEEEATNPQIPAVTMGRKESSSSAGDAALSVSAAQSRPPPEPRELATIDATEDIGRAPTVPNSQESEAVSPVDAASTEAAASRQESDGTADEAEVSSTAPAPEVPPVVAAQPPQPKAGQILGTLLEPQVGRPSSTGAVGNGRGTPPVSTSKRAAAVSSAGTDVSAQKAVDRSMWIFIASPFSIDRRGRIEHDPWRGKAWRFSNISIGAAPGPSQWAEAEIASKSGTNNVKHRRAIRYATGHQRVIYHHAAVRQSNKASASAHRVDPAYPVVVPY